MKTREILKLGIMMLTWLGHRVIGTLLQGIVFLLEAI